MERREIIDMATGIGGGLLLVLAIVLFAVVPQDEPTIPTFRVAYVGTETTVPFDQVTEFGEGDTISFPLSVDSQYVHRIQFDVEWTDDVAASTPDTFNFKIISPDGERVLTEPLIIANEPGNTTSDPTTYEAVPITLEISKSIQAPPRDGPVPGEHLDEDAANVRARLLEDIITYPAGDWVLEVYLDDAGDCPSPTGDSQRSFACAAETSNSEDTGNSLRVLSATYTTYDVQVQASSTA